MRKKLALLAGTTVVSVVMALGGAGVAFAGSVNQSAPGTPGTPNCVGQTTAYLAQAGPSVGSQPGIGNLASTAGLTVQQVKDIVDSYCAE